MSSKAELAGNYVASGGSADDADYVAEKLAEMQPETTAAETTVGHDETRDHIETAADPETVTLSIRGETLRCDPVGVGDRLRPVKKAQTAEREGDDLKAAEAILDMIDVLVRVSPDAYDRAFFDGLNETELRDTYRTLGQKSAAGNE